MRLFRLKYVHAPVSILIFCLHHIHHNGGNVFFKILADDEILPLTGGGKNHTDFCDGVVGF